MCFSRLKNIKSLTFKISGTLIVKTKLVSYLLVYILRFYKEYLEFWQLLNIKHNHERKPRLIYSIHNNLVDPPCVDEEYEESQPGEEGQTSHHNHRAACLR
jgi:hypothetical protein